MFRRVLAALVCVSALTLPAAAQEQTGAITGTVKDSSGAVLPGVTVEAHHLALAAVAASTTTDAAGVYRFPALQPGKYDIIAKLQGFTPAKVASVDLRLGKLLSADLVLNVGSLSETVQVSAETPIIDVKQSARGTNITSEEFERLPKGRDFTSIVTQAPGANNEPRSGGISIDGSSAAENRFIIDGAETTNVVDGTSGKNLITDFVEEVQVKSSGYQAEYGGSTGGVINVVTKSGTNRFRGDLLSYFSGDNLESAFRPNLRLVPINSRLAEYVTYPEDSFTRFEPGFDIGGPIVRDRLWFFGSFLPSFTDTDRTVTARADGVTRTTNQKIKTYYSSNNVTGQATNNLRLKFAVNMSPQKREGLLPNLDGTTSPTAVLGIDRKQPNYSYSGSADYVINSGWFAGIRGGYFTRDVQDTGVFEGTRYVFSNSTNIGMAGVPANLQQATGYSNAVTNSKTTKDKNERFNLQADTTWYMNLGGTHTFKAGAQWDYIAQDIVSGNTGNVINLNWDKALSGQRGTFGYYEVISNGVLPDLGFITQGKVGNTNFGLFIQDSWTINSRFTLNLGLRTENESVPSYAIDPNLPDPAIEFKFGDKLAPRVGFAWDLMGDGKNKVYGSWGIFYDILKLELGLTSFGGDKWISYYYTLDTPDWQNLDTSGCPTSCPGRFLNATDFRHPSNEAIDPDIDPMKLQEAVIGFERELNARMAVGLRYVHKQVDVAIEDIGSYDPAIGETYIIGNPGFHSAANFTPVGMTQAIAYPKAVRDYDAVEASFDKRFADNWSLRASYTWSRLHGNYSGLSQSDENGRVTPNIGRNFDYTVMSFDETGQPVFGALATDRPHQFKLQGIYDFKFGTTVGANYFIASGVPVSREARFFPPSNYPVTYLGRLSDGRTPVLSQTDLFVQHQFRIGGDRTIGVSLNVINLFDQSIATNRFQAELASGQGINITEAQFFQGVNTQALITAQNLLRDPRFLMNGQTSATLGGAGFQVQRAARIGVKFSF
jgi:Carboxypeptidase regulatory-like domain/TonB dependent receptor/TonB-dependent Receptor Plug Domain